MIGDALRRYVRDVRLAVNFFTRLPGGLHTSERAEVTASFRAAPLIGALIGLIGGGVYGVSNLALPAFAAGALAVGAQLLATGAFHEDGWADFWDGLGGASAEKRLTIMRDSRIGTYGAAALILALFLKISLIKSLGWPLALPALIVAGALARGAVVMVMAAVPPARGDGLAAQAGALEGPALILALATAAAPAAFLGFSGVGAIFGAVLGAGLTALIAKRTLGGQTGDVLGACAVAGELGALVALTAVG